MAIKLATLYALIGIKDEATGALNAFSRQLSSASGNMQQFGAAMMTLTAPIAEGLSRSVKAATDFNSSMTNISAVTGTTGAALDKINQSILNIGTNSRYGANAAAQAFYDIAGSTTDAAVRMPLLVSAIHTAQAGQADLMGTTKALTSVMNAYGLKAEDVTYISDVLTQTVALGVGTMDQFAAALPKVTGTAKMLGISFGKLGGMAAYLTTKGFTASQSMTMLSSMMNALLKPNAKMQEALKKIGFESGKTAVENLGLLGTYQKLIDAGYGDEIAKITGRIEAFRGVTALSQAGADKFLTTFEKGIKGARESAEWIQMNSFAAQSDVLRSELEKLSIVIGNALLPVLNEVIQKIIPIVWEIGRWIEKNPQAAQTIIEIVAALTVIGPAAFIAGTTLSALTTIIGGIGAVIGLILSPIGLLIGAIAVVGLLANQHFGGLDKMIHAAYVSAQQLSILVAIGMSTAFNWLYIAVSKVKGAIDGVVTSLTSTYDKTKAIIDLLTSGKLNYTPGFTVDPSQQGVNGGGSSDLLDAAGGGHGSHMSFANGGLTPSRATLAMVGEKGHEYVVPAQGAPVSGGGGGPETIHLILQAHDFEQHIYYNVSEGINRGHAIAAGGA